MVSTDDELADEVEEMDLNTSESEKDRAKRLARNKEKREARKKRKNIDQLKEAVPGSDVCSLAPEEREELWKQQLQEALSQKVIPPVAYEVEQKSPHHFWDTQPVPRFGEGFQEEGPLEHKTIEDIPTEPFPIADTLMWSVVDVKDPAQLDEVYNLLKENYVEDEDAMFRFNYSKEFLTWALTPPHFEKDWHVGVRRRADSALIAFIAGVPATIRLGATIKTLCEINYLCVHKRARDKRMAPLLIKEVTRRVNRKGIFQAVYTAGIMLPKPFARCRYWHRSLNPLKLVDIGFSRIPAGFEKFRDARSMTERHYRLPEQPQIQGLRKMHAGDVRAVRLMLNNFLNRYAIAPEFTIEEAEHWLLPREGVLESYVVEVNGSITDFFSFYSLPSTIIAHPKYNNLMAAYCYYYFASSVPVETLLLDALNIASKCGYDVFNALDMLENGSILSQLKFGMGDGHLHYYLFNWRFPEIPSKLVGLVML